MPTHIDAVLFKKRIHDMVAFAAEHGVELPLSLGYELAARFLFGTRSWNHLSGKLKEDALTPDIILSTLDQAQAGAVLMRIPDEEVILVGGVEKDGKLMYKYRSLEDGRDCFVDVDIRALAMDDNFKLTSASPVAKTIHRLSDEHVLELWEKHRENPHLFDGRVERYQLLSYVRAFRPHLFGKVLALESRYLYENFDRPIKYRCEVTGPYTSDTGWSVIVADKRVYSATGAPYFETEAAAYEALVNGIIISQSETHHLSELFLVPIGTGYKESLETLQAEANKKVRMGPLQVVVG